MHRLHKVWSSVLQGKKSRSGIGSFNLVTHVDIDANRFRDDSAHWEAEKIIRKEGWKGKLDRCVDSARWEVVVSICVLFDLLLTLTTFVASNEFSESDSVFIVSAIFLSVMLVDVFLRVVKDGVLFFRSWLNWLEAFVAIGSAVFLTLNGIQRTCSGPDCNASQEGKGASLGRAVRPLLRVFRVLRAASHVFFNRGGLHKKFDRIADKIGDQILRSLIGTFMLCPPENISLTPSNGQFHLEKAQVKSAAFSDVHLPFTIRGGLIDMAHVDVSITKAKHHLSGHSSHRLLIVVENALLVLGPGHHQEEPAPAWTFQAVYEKKKRLIDMINKEIDKVSKSKKDGGHIDGMEELLDEDNAAGGPGKKKKKTMALDGPKRATKRLRERFFKMLDEVFSHGMHMSVRNVEIRYEDSQGELSGGTQVVGGVEVGSIQIRAQGVSDYQADEEDFRVRGKWRPGCAAAFLEERAKHSGKNGVNKDDGASRKTQKRTLRNGVRAAMHVNRLAIFWDLHEASVPPEVTGVYTPHLQEGMQVDLLRFLKDCRAKRARERVRMAIIGEVEQRLADQADNAFECEPEMAAVAGGPTDERLRRLRDRVFAHRYILMPCGCSVHGTARPFAKLALARQGVQDPDLEHFENEIKDVENRIASLWKKDKDQADMFREKFKAALGRDYLKGGLDGTWPPQTDIDVHIPRIPCAVDMAQARSIVGLIDYLKRWRIEDRTMMFHPDIYGETNLTVWVRWAYALHQVLHGIDEKYSWHSLFWVEMRRRARVKSQYLQYLAEPTENDEILARLQVGLPFAEILISRKAAAMAAASQKRTLATVMRQTVRNTLRTSFRAVRQSVRSHSTKSGDTAQTSEAESSTALEVRQDRCSLVMINYKETHQMVKDKIQEVRAAIAIPPAENAEQLQIRVGLLQANLLQPTTWSTSPVRRPLVKLEAAGIVLVGSRSAPPKVWMRLAPPSAAADAAAVGKAPEGVAAEVAVQDVRAIFCGMPTAAHKLRRLVGAPRIKTRSIADPLAKLDDCLCGRGDSSLTDEVVTMVAEAGHIAEHAMHELRFFVSEESSYLSKQLGETSNNAASYITGKVGHSSNTARKKKQHLVLSEEPSYSSHTSVHSPKSRTSRRNKELASFDSSRSATSAAQYRRVASDLLTCFSEGSSPEFFMQMRFAFVGESMMQSGEEDGSKRLVPHWVFSAWTFPLEVNACLPLMKQIAWNFKPRDRVPRWFGTAPGVKRFWEDLRQLRNVHNTTTVRREKKARRAELLTGAVGPLHGSWISGEVLLRGGMRGMIIRSYTKDTWLRCRSTMPKGSMKIDRLVDPPRLKVGFKPSGDSTESYYQSSDGWWFATEAEADSQSSIIQTGQPSPLLCPGDDHSCAGKDANEGFHDLQDPLFVLPDHVLSTWGMNRDGTRTARCKPPVSAKGLMPLALPRASRSGTRIIPGCPVQMDCCSSLERNMPAPLQPVAFAMTAALPEHCPAAPCSRPSVAAKHASTKSEAPTKLLISTGGVAPFTPPGVTTPAPSTAASAPQVNLIEARMKLAAEIDKWTLSEMGGSIEVICHETVGLPEPTPAALDVWWRSLGILVD